MKRILFCAFVFVLPLITLCQLQTTPIKIDKSLQKILDQACKNTSLKLPYGDENFFYNFPAAWQNYYTGKKNNTDTTKNFLLDSLVGRLDNFFYADVTNSSRTAGTVLYENNKLLFTPHFKPTESKKKYQKNIQVKCITLFKEKAFTVYSLVFSGDEYCNKCEFIVKQTQHVLVCLNNQNKITDKLLIGNIKGNDLGRYRLYFYIDSKKTIHLKEFSSDELEDGFLKYRKYTISPLGYFIKLK